MADNALTQPDNALTQAEQESLTRIVGTYREACHQARVALRMQDYRMAEVALGRAEALDTDSACGPYTDQAFEDAFNRICVVHRAKAAYLRVDKEPVLKKKNLLKAGGNADVRQALEAAVQAAPGVNPGRAKVISGEQAAAAVRALIQSKSVVTKRTVKP